MNPYEEQFGTDWDSLTRDEAMMRAFALGAAASLGHENTAEYEAIQAEMATNYDASIVELAYEEGKGKTKRQMERTDARGMTLWRRLLVDEFDVEQLDLDEEIDVGEFADAIEEAVRATDFPSAVAERTDAIDHPDLDPEQTEFPDFLE
ncbi:hypothetical protein [Halorientalis salina]|uniref:hypothetical protein n=1 Tax=Halorientalis salina TaxID=2932266 RepID=UPI0010AD8BF9|nr:hypothetical protein [Halorientalis salina]